MPLESKVLYEFGRFRLDPDQHLLVLNEEPIALTPKAYDLLLTFVQSGGRLLTKDELMRKVWADSFVEEANLTVTISALRKAIGDTSDEQQLIETVPRRGYRFKAKVVELSAQTLRQSQPSRQMARGPGISQETASQSSPGVAIQRSATSRSKHLLVASIAAAFVIILAVAFVNRPKGSPPEPSSVRPVAAAAPELHRIAILPFQNIRHDPDNDFLGYSLADVIITKLGYLSVLSVRPSASIQKYRNQVIDIKKVASELDVDTLLTGSFIREGNDLRINYQLLDVNSQKILGRGSIDLKYDKLLKVQDAVSQEVIGALELNLSPSEAARIHSDAPVNPVAYEYYLRGVDLYGKHDFPLAIKMLEKSIEIDSNYALTWAYLGASYTSDAAFELGGRPQYRKAESAYDRALRIQPTQIEARLFLANLLVDNGRVEEAVPLLRDALHTNPNRADVHWELGYAYRFAGMLEESVQECELARKLDPLVRANGAALNTYLYLGNYDKFLQSLPDENDVAFIIFYRGFGEFHLKQYDRAASDFDRAYSLNSTLYTQIGKAFSAAIAHQNAEGLGLLRDLEKKIAERGVGDPEGTYKMAEAYSTLGDKDSALRVFRSSVVNGFFSYPYFLSDPLLEAARQDPRFAATLELARQRHEEFRRKFF